MWKSIVVSLTLALLLMPAAPARSACVGDCDGDGEVAITDLVLGVNIALGTAAIDRCTALDTDGDREVIITELVQAVNAALTGCEPPGSTTTPTATPTPTRVPPTPTPTAPCVAAGVSSVVATSASPASGQGALDGCVTVENAGGTRTELTRVSVRGAVNGRPYLLQVYFVTETGAVDTVSYGWDPAPDFPDLFNFLAFCNTPDCSGASVDLGTKTVRLNSTALSVGSEPNAVLNGTITLDSIPVPEPTVTPTSGPQCPGGSATLNFSEVQGTNPSTPFPATLVLGAAQNFSRAADPPAIAYFSALYDGCPSAFPRLTLGFQFSGFAIEPGTTYQVGSVSGQLNQIEFREERFSNFRSWEAQSGTMIIDAVDAAGVTFRIVDARMRPKDLGTTGTFVLNVSGTLAP